jgi:hypothetical protein
MSALSLVILLVLLLIIINSMLRPIGLSLLQVRLRRKGPSIFWLYGLEFFFLLDSGVVAWKELKSLQCCVSAAANLLDII